MAGDGRTGAVTDVIIDNANDPTDDELSCPDGPLADDVEDEEVPA